MSLLGGIIGVDVGDVLTQGINGAVSVLTSNNALQIASLNLQAQAAQTERETAASNTNNANTRLLITGGLILGGVVLAIRALRK